MQFNQPEPLSLYIHNLEFLWLLSPQEPSYLLSKSTFGFSRFTYVVSSRGSQAASLLNVAKVICVYC